MSIRKGIITEREIENATPYLSDIEGFPCQCPGIGFYATSHHAIIVACNVNGTKYGIIEAARKFTNNGFVEIIGLSERSSQDGSYDPDYCFSKLIVKTKLKKSLLKLRH